MNQRIIGLNCDGGTEIAKFCVDFVSCIDIIYPIWHKVQSDFRQFIIDRIAEEIRNANFNVEQLFI